MSRESKGEGMEKGGDKGEAAQMNVPSSGLGRHALITAGARMAPGCTCWFWGPCRTLFSWPRRRTVRDTGAVLGAGDTGSTQVHPFEQELVAGLDHAGAEAGRVRRVHAELLQQTAEQRRRAGWAVERSRLHHRHSPYAGTRAAAATHELGMHACWQQYGMGCSHGTPAPR